MTETNLDQICAREKISPPKFEIKKGETKIIGDSLVKFFATTDAFFGNLDDIYLKINDEAKIVCDGEEIQIGEKFFRVQRQFVKNSGEAYKITLTENPKMKIGKTVRKFLKNLFRN